ncbi:MAG TPA: type II toxin-antitoxin system VapC family toxin [Blastocatellia bacterium]|nr:type II toxin-antitoxin system VapC family toxin [Blastocatellia bacterium]
MAKLVVDASVAIKWFVVEPLSVEARRILDDYEAGTLSLVAPDLINAEIGNIVWKKQTFQGLSTDDAKAVIDGFRKLEIAFTSTAHLLSDAYNLAITHRRTVYDSLYLALSIREACQFVTADERLVNAVSSVLPTAVWLANWP